MINIENQSAQQKEKSFKTLYQKLTEEGVQAFKDKDAFEEACHMTIKLCLSVNDYIHSNNIMQIYKTNQLRNRASWYHYYGILIYGKRYPRYFLKKPEALKKKVNRYLINGDSNQLNQALINLMLFYAKLYQNYTDTFKADLVHFITYFKNHPLKSMDNFQAHIQELDDFIKGTIDYEDIGFDTAIKKVDDSPSIQPKPTQIADDNQEFRVYVKDPKVIIIGDLSISKDKVYGIAKNTGFKKQQIEIHSDYDKIKSLDISHLRHSEQYCGIIFGPIPHSTTSNQGDTSLITHVENIEGYPYFVKAIASNQLKLTKNSLEKSFREIYSNLISTSL